MSHSVRPGYGRPCRRLETLLRFIQNSVMEAVMTLAPVENPYLSGNHGPVDVETTAYDLQITGALPRELDGRYHSNGIHTGGRPDWGALGGCGENS